MPCARQIFANSVVTSDGDIPWIMWEMPLSHDVLLVAGQLERGRGTKVRPGWGVWFVWLVWLVVWSVVGFGLLGCLVVGGVSLGGFLVWSLGLWVLAYSWSLALPRRIGLWDCSMFSVPPSCGRPVVLCVHWECAWFGSGWLGGGWLLGLCPSGILPMRSSGRHLFLSVC